jgi:predicted metal-binding protein
MDRTGALRVETAYAHLVTPTSCSVCRLCVSDRQSHIEQVRITCVQFSLGIRSASTYASFALRLSDPAVNFLEQATVRVVRGGQV